ncbi:MAG: HAD family hydrolase [SAR324 cluster bacterium]|nr:HAD family hydrolase [SAR324 cluster bacterium]
MTLALFDLDNTLLEGDSEVFWMEYLLNMGMVHNRSLDQMNAYHKQYEEGTLNIREYQSFVLAPLAKYDITILEAHRTKFLSEKIWHRIRKWMLPRLEWHRNQQHTLLLITATNDFITTPIANYLEIPHLLASQAEIIKGSFTGKISGIPCFRDGKVAKLKEWLSLHDEDTSGSWFYSDSRNDIPLLQEVAHPVAVTPDPLLKDFAEKQEWMIMEMPST